MSRNNWPDQKAYATTNENEYLGEATEAYFGTNDLYRYVISELRRHDRGRSIRSRSLGGRTSRGQETGRESSAERTATSGMIKKSNRLPFSDFFPIFSDFFLDSNTCRRDDHRHYVLAMNGW